VLVLLLAGVMLCATSAGLVDRRSGAAPRGSPGRGSGRPPRRV